MEVEKYREYLISTWQPEYEAEHSTRVLTVTGWNLLLDEVFSPIIKKELGLRYLGNRIWADDYSEHRRRVLGLFQQTDLGGTFKWGWNFDFVPKMSGKNAVYARTDKTIFPHFFENIYANHDQTKNPGKKEDMFFDRCRIDIADYENSMNEKVREHTNAFYQTLPLIRSFYEETATYEQTITMIDTLLESSYYQMIQGNGLYITKLFLQQYVGMGEDNEKKLREFFPNEIQRENFCKKFVGIPVREV